MNIIILSKWLTWVGVRRCYVFKRHAIANPAVRDHAIIVIRFPLGTGKSDHEILHCNVYTLANALALTL